MVPMVSQDLLVIQELLEPLVRLAYKELLVRQEVKAPLDLVV